MTHTYSISGMTCGNCVSKVKSELLKIGDVIQAEIQLSRPQASITMQKHVPVSTLQNAINKAGNFVIAEMPGDYHPADHESDDNQRWKLYWPLILVFTFITGIAIITSFQQGQFNWMGWMNNFMGGFFIAFSFFKFLDLKGFAESYATYDLLASRWRGYGYVYPFAELALGIAYITGFNPLVTNFATIIIMGFSSLGVIRAILNKRKIRCACLGTVFKLPMSTVTVTEDLLMVAMAAVAIVVIL
jgi:copper chaperone CopZ